MQLSENFRSEEFKCPVCGSDTMDVEFIGMLQRARFIAGIPFHINSGFRCEEHNRSKAVGGKPNSAHLRGLAADVACIHSGDRWRIVDAALRAGFKRLGVSSTFIHLDCDNSLPNEMIWVK